METGNVDRRLRAPAGIEGAGALRADAGNDLGMRPSSAFDHIASPGTVLRIMQPILLPSLIFALALVMILWPFNSREHAAIATGGGLTVLLIGWFACNGVKDHIAAVGFFALAVTLADIPPKVVFSGFASSGTWLIFGGMILAAALQRSGLAGQIAARMLPGPGISYWAAIASVILVSLLLVVMVPSTVARILLLVPIALAFAERLGYAPGSRASTGMVLAAALSTYYCAVGALTATLTNVAMVSLAESLYSLPINYGQFFLAAFPVLCVGTGLLLTIAVSLFYREPSIATVNFPRHTDPIGQGNIQISLILVAAVALWATDFIHGIAPAWIALSASVLCLLGPARNLTLSDGVKFDAWILFPAFLSLGAVLKYTGSAEWAGQWLLDHAPLTPGADWANLAVVTAIGAVLSLGATNLASPVLFTALAEPLSAATGWPLDAVLLVGIPTWTIVPFAYQAPILIIGLKMAGIPIGAVSRFFLAFCALVVVILVPLHFLWLRVLGYFG